MNINEDIIKVILRFRPLIESELFCVPLSCIEIVDSLVTVYFNNNSLSFTFDKVLNSFDNQEVAFVNGPADIVENVMKGFNGTIFAYGNICSGKTYTMFGDLLDAEKAGVIPRAILKIFDLIEAADESIEFLIKVSFFELANEKIIDLLNPLEQKLKIKTTKKGVHIQNLREVYTTSDSDVQDLLRIGLSNKSSLKSRLSCHTFFSLTIQQTSSTLGTIFSKLYLVDLAGVERSNSLPNSPRFSSIKSINTSLSTLAMVICALSDRSNTYIPYRASKLTKILEESLGGNSKTAVIITCSPSPLNCDQTISSLRFGMGLKSVRNRPVVNRELSMFELNVQYLQKLEILRGLNRKVTALVAKKAMIVSERQSLRCSVFEIESPRMQFDYSELKAELQEIYLRVEQQEELSKKLESSITEDEETLKQAKNTDGKLEKLVLDITKHCDILEEELKETEETVERSNTAIERTKAEIEARLEELTSLEQRIDELSSENEHFKCKLKCLKEMRSSLSKAAVEEQLRRRIKEEKINNKTLKEEIKKIQEEIDLLLFKRFKEYVVAEDLQVSAKKISDLEVQIEAARMKYLEDEKNLTGLQRVLKHKRDVMNKAAEKMDKEYRNVTTKHAEMALEKSILQKKISRLEEKADKLEETIAKVEKKLKKVQKFNETSGNNPMKIMRSGSVRASVALRQMKLSIDSMFQE